MSVLLLNYSKRCECCYYFVYVLSWVLKCSSFSWELNWYFRDHLFMFQVVFLNIFWARLHWLDAHWSFLYLNLLHVLCACMWTCGILYYFLIITFISPIACMNFNPKFIITCSEICIPPCSENPDLSCDFLCSTSIEVLVNNSFSYFPRFILACLALFVIFLHVDA